MAKTEKTEKGSKMESWMNGLKAEFKKIIWPNKDTITKQTVLVLVVSLALGLIIGVLDLVIKFGLNLIL